MSDPYKYRFSIMELGHRVDCSFAPDVLMWSACIEAFPRQVCTGRHLDSIIPEVIRQ